MSDCIHVMSTEAGSWECPDCGRNNDMFLLKEQKLPEYLHCSICNHESEHIIWYKEKE